ncbi:hypothetical protein JB92DRAFT_3140322 [Gautieria morchelliformis]|nr:hypothetical protein JB92DRAFT_3140322 [Gautieria morchelliformis]
MFSLVYKLSQSVQALFAAFHSRPTSRSSTSENNLYSGNPPARQPAAVIRVPCTRPLRVSVQEIAARFNTDPHTSKLPPSLPSTSWTSAESVTRALRVPRRTCSSRVSAMEVACRFSIDRTRGIEVKQALTNLLAAAAPTLLQSLFNQPSQRYARSPPHRQQQPARVQPHRLSPTPTPSSTRRPDAYPAPKFSPPPSPAPSPDSDVFFTPLPSPTVMDPSKSPHHPSSSTASITEDDLFSAHSATTSATSLSLSSGTRRKSKSRSRSPDWSKDVRWLVPTDSSCSSRTSLIQGLDLVDVDYEPEQAPSKPRSRTKARRKSRPDRMSALWEEEEDFDDQSTPKSTPMRARTLSTSPKRPRPTSMLSRSSTVSTARTVSLPTPLPVSSGVAVSSAGYTGLTLPRAAYAPSRHPGRVSSSVDITRSGLAQTTMSTIAIARRPHTSSTPTHLRASLPSPLSFSAHTPPPNKVHSSQVLVQVWAVGLDALDALLVEERAARNDGLGYVPGRSFAGRAVECGWGVNNASKGDWVIGITEVRKSGALSEFIVVDRRRIHRAPRPSQTLTVPQLALLPLTGIPAHRAVRTLAHLPRGARALVLHAHDGAGLLAAQELVALGFRVTAQVPGPWGSRCEKRARGAGVGDVRCGDAVEVVRDVREEEFDAVVDPLGGKEVWDACRKVLRTAGQFTTLVGDAESALPTANAHFKSNMRSLRRAFVKKGHKSVGYQWVSPAADVDSGGEDVRDTLAAVVRLAVEGVVIPYAGEVAGEGKSEAAKTFPFERAPEAFKVDPVMECCMLSRGGTAVVRIID